MMSDSSHMSAASKQTQTRFPWFLLFCSIVAFAILLGLGTWQLQRLYWKEGIIDTIERRIHAAPQPLSEIEKIYTETGSVDYWPVTMQGVFLHDHERHFFTTHQGSTGFAVYTPLRLADDRVILVNRGFVPYELKDRKTRSADEVEGVVTVTGLARDPLNEKPSSYLPDNDPVKNIFYWKDWGAMTASAELATVTRFVSFFVDADAAPNPGGWPIGGITITDQPNSHLQYAATWYGLALVLLVIVGIYLGRWYKTRRG